MAKYIDYQALHQADVLDEIRENANKKSLDPLFKGAMRWPDETILRKLKARGIQ